MKDLICILLQAVAPSMPQLSNFCRKCGGKIAMMVPPGENEERHVCSDCGYVDYYNPKLVNFQEPIMRTSAVAACELWAAPSNKSALACQ